MVAKHRQEQELEFSILNGSPEQQPTACMVIGIFEARKLSATAAVLDGASKGYISNILERGDLEGHLGSTLLLHRVPGVKAERLLLVGLGKEREFGGAEYRRAISAATQQLQNLGGTDAINCLSEIVVRGRDASWLVEQAIVATSDALYRFDRLKSKPGTDSCRLQRTAFTVSRNKQIAGAKQGLPKGLAVAAGMSLAKDLGNLPGNICTPAYLADTAKSLASEHGMSIDILERAQMEALGMNTLLSVASGSHQEPKFIVLEHRNAPNQKPIVLIGKGVTFDSGGISLKPGAEMDEMKFDMCGAASVLGAMKTAAMLGLPLNIIGIIPATENLPGGNASKPGDIVTSMSGQTVEILNTDAEGRLILCDALTYAERFRPSCVIDVATLTGACVIALGHIASGLFANDEALGKDLLDAGQIAHDRAWLMPLWSEYQDALKSNFADMANIGGRPGGAITAASFLSKFAAKYPWAHLDIAGTAWKSGKEKGATGRPVHLLAEFLALRARSGAAAKTRSR